MKKVILNKSYGGFGVSKKGYELYAKKKGLTLYQYESKYQIDKKDFIYKRATEESLFNHYLTKDFGDYAHISNEEYEKYHLSLRDEHREDHVLIEVVEELGDEANGTFSELRIVEIPDDLDYVIDEYDGLETLHQKVQEW